MNTFHLLNSAMMPSFGSYTYQEVGPEDFGKLVRSAHNLGCLRSYIGYQQTADMISRLAGVPIPVSRDQTELKNGDTLLIARLRYRVSDPKTKGEPVVEDFVFGCAAYSSELPRFATSDDNN